MITRESVRANFTVNGKLVDYEEAYQAYLLSSAHIPAISNILGQHTYVGRDIYTIGRIVVLMHLQDIMVEPSKFETCTNIASLLKLLGYGTQFYALSKVIDYVPSGLTDNMRTLVRRQLLAFTTIPVIPIIGNTCIDIPMNIAIFTLIQKEHGFFQQERYGCEELAELGVGVKLIDHIDDIRPYFENAETFEEIRLFDFKTKVLDREFAKQRDKYLSHHGVNLLPELPDTFTQVQTLYDVIMFDSEQSLAVAEEIVKYMDSGLITLYTFTLPNQTEPFMVKVEKDGDELVMSDLITPYSVVNGAGTFAILQTLYNELKRVNALNGR